ncbi:MAG: prolyl aminopeptidase [Pseudomonadota bacterium]|nr:prolyl aminopeptidase [Pseudomonadota bacterium]
MSGASLYPSIHPNRSGMLQVDLLHSLYWEESGNPQGIPILFLHGGPGAGTVPENRRFFDPKAYRIILFDQRGSGRSTPAGEINQNTTQMLVSDIEALRQFLNVDRWALFGGSWGSTLALIYAEMFPKRCIGLVLRGIFLCRPHEIEWFLYGMQSFFPENWATFAEHLPADERENLLHNYHKRLVNPDPAIHMPAALAWSIYEGSCSTLMPNNLGLNQFTRDQFALSLARTEAHYFVNKIFLAENFILDRAEVLSDIPGVIIQGRYDMVCPMASAVDLSEVWGRARLIVVPDAGHSSSEKGITEALIRATNGLRDGEIL